LIILISVKGTTTTTNKTNTTATADEINRGDLVCSVYVGFLIDTLFVIGH
jgi:hypothetical protein